MKRISFFLFLLFSISLQLVAQDIHFGVKGGLNYSNFIGEGTIDSQYKPGFHLGAFAEIPLKGKLSFHPELLYSAHGYRFDRNLIDFNDPFLLPDDDFKVAYNNLIVPLITKFNFNDNLSLELGPQLGFLLNSVSNFSPNQEKTRESGNFQFTYGATLGMGFDPTDKLKLQLRYYLGLKNFFDEVFRESEFEKRYSFESVLQLSVGYVIF